MELARLTCIAALAAMAFAASVGAQVVPVAREAVAVRGHPTLVEVKVGVDAAVPPVEFVEFAPRVPVAARVLWPFIPAPAGDSLLRWAAPTNPTRLMDVRPEGATSAYLAFDVPADAPDALRVAIGAASVSIAVYEPAPGEFVEQLSRRASMVAPQGARDPLLSLPDPEAPFERFRHVLGVAMRGWSEPAPFAAGSADECAARANTALWMAALARAFAGGAGPVTELAELLVATCSDETAVAPIAAWIAGPEELRSILRIALERDFTPERLSAGINELLRVRSPVLWWIEDSDLASVTIAFANPTTRAQVVRQQWLAGSEDDLVPLALDVPAAEVRRMRITRPERVRGSFAAMEPDFVERLRVSCGGLGVNVLVPPALLPTDARGLRLEGVFAPLSLPSVSSPQRGVLSARNTRISVRERLAGWEIFVEMIDVDDVGHGMRVVGAPSGSVRIDPTGSAEFDGVSLGADALEFAMQDGGGGAGALPSCRAGFVMPPEWIQRDDERTVVEIGFRREVAGGYVDAPYPTVPWRARPRLGAIDLSPRQ